MSNFPRPRALRRPGQSVLRDNTVFIGLPRGNGGSSSGPPGPPVPPANPPETVTYVAPNGSDITGERGNPLLPFATMQAAVDAALSGDTIVVAPGNYPAPWAVPLAKNLAVVGDGTPQNVSVGPLNWNPSTGERLTLENLFINGALLSDGQPYTADFFGQRCVFGGSGLSTVNMESVNLSDCSGLVTIVDSLRGNYRANDGALTLSVNTTSNIPGKGIHRVSGRYAGLNAIQCLGETEMRCDKATNADNLRIGDLGVTSLGQFGRIAFEGIVSGDVSCQTAFANPANPLVNLTDATVRGTLTATHVGPNPSVIRARNSAINSAVMSTTSGALTLDTTGGTDPNVLTSTFNANTFHLRKGGGARLLGVASGPPAVSVLWTSLGGILPGAPYPPGTPVAYVAQGESDSLFIQNPDSDGFDLVNNFASPQDVSIVYAISGP
jgi:hypothetical protein